MNALAAGQWEAFLRTQEQAVAARDRGDWTTARACFTACRELAQAAGDPVAADGALCSAVAAGIELGETSGAVATLREVLVRSADLEVACHAAYTIGRAYEREQQYKKALFYAQLALDRAHRLEAPTRLGLIRNLKANLLVAESRFEEARHEYEAAYELLRAAGDLPVAVAGYNLGYCLTVLGERRAGLRLAYGAVRALARLGAVRHEAMARLDLCYALLEVERPALARRHGRRALAIARRVGDAQIEKNALFLLGEAARLTGDEIGARRLFKQLQAGFFPDSDYLPDVLMAVDVRRLINLKV